MNNHDHVFRNVTIAEIIVKFFLKYTVLQKNQTQTYIAKANLKAGSVITSDY